MHEMKISDKFEYHHGDCISILGEMGDQSFDHTLTSPPYNRKRNDKYQEYDDTIEDWYQFNLDVIDELLRVTKGHIFYNIQTNYYNRAEVYRLIGHYSREIREIIVWEKTNPMPASGSSVTNAIEYILVLGATPLKSNTTYTKNVIHSSVNSKMPKQHKAVMKQEVADHIISKFTKEGDHILDCFMGMGTTGKSCKAFNRMFSGIELIRNYYLDSITGIDEY